MICKVATISHTKNALDYCEKGGELVHSNYVFGSAKDINKDMLELQNRNTRTEKKGLHAIISFNPQDDLTDYTHIEYSEIAEKYAEKHGFSENQYAVYLHQDKAHTHLHIVANRIGYDNKCVSSSHSYAKNREFSREMEQEYNLIRTNRKKGSKEIQTDFSYYPGADFISEDKRLLKVKELIDRQIPQCKNIKELEVKLLNFGIKTYKGRGISFVDSAGAKFKGSQLGREYSIKGLEKQISNNQNRGIAIKQSRNQEETKNAEVQQISDKLNIDSLPSKKEEDFPYRKKRKRKDKGQSPEL